MIICYFITENECLPMQQQQQQQQQNDEKFQGLLLDFEAIAYKLDGFSQYSKMVYTK